MADDYKAAERAAQISYEAIDLIEILDEFGKNIVRKMVQELRHGVDSHLASRTAWNTNTATAASYTWRFIDEI